jgi:hypothetical protein
MMEVGLRRRVRPELEADIIPAIAQGGRPPRLPQGGVAGRAMHGQMRGDGWGWSWFDAGNPTKTTSTDFKVNCLGCHVPAQATDWIYVNGYPPLKG